SIVERCFGILNDEVIHRLIGTTRRGKIVKGEPTPQSRACLTIQEVTSLLIREILAHNQRTYEELAYINPLLIENDLVISPKNSWMISLKHGRFSARAVGADEVIARLLIPVNAKEGANKRGNSSRLTQSFHFFMFEPIFFSRKCLESAYLDRFFAI
nr:hypothetical protein [Escherichia coli]